MMLQILFHLIGDYITQSDWMATNKTKSSRAALAHATVYSLPFCFIADGNARAIIFITHFLIDRYRLARQVVWLKNMILDPRLWRLFWFNLRHDSVWDEPYPDDLEEFDLKYRWENCNTSGYPSDAPPWLAFWLLIIADNTLHLSINYLAIRFL